MRRAVLLAASLAAAIGPAASARLSSGFRGTVRIGPTTPVCRPGVPCDAGYATRVVIRNARTGTRVTTVRSDSHGRFTARLPAGRYRLQASGGRPYPRCAPVTAQVRRDRFTRVALSCDSGLR
jgi:hypothetical protein